jgi:hypothetical protein
MPEGSIDTWRTTEIRKPDPFPFDDLADRARITVLSAEHR